MNCPLVIYLTIIKQIKNNYKAICNIIQRYTVKNKWCVTVFKLLISNTVSHRIFRV